jgi:hypothetical protein
MLKIRFQLPRILISDLLIFFCLLSGEDLELECITTGANPPAKLRWFLGEQVPN